MVGLSRGRQCPLPASYTGATQIWHRHLVPHHVSEEETDPARRALKFCPRCCQGQLQPHSHPLGLNPTLGQPQDPFLGCGCGELLLSWEQSLCGCRGWCQRGASMAAQTALCSQQGHKGLQSGKLGPVGSMAAAGGLCQLPQELGCRAGLARSRMLRL